jgi:hypothetical protein
MGMLYAGMFYVPKFNCEISNISQKKDKGILLTDFTEKNISNANKAPIMECQNGSKTSTDAKRELFSFRSISLKTFVN